MIDPLSHLFDKQTDVIEDPSRFKALLCGGRAGKTITAVHDIAHGMLTEPGSANLYVGQTRTSAADIFWRPFCLANVEHGWGFTTNETTKSAKHANGSWMLCAGADDRRELEKRRGTPWRRVRIDECGAQRPAYLEYFIEQVIEPRLMDHGGDIWLLGTPGLQAYGYFYEATTGLRPGWSVHSWTAVDNPHVDYLRFIYGTDDEEGLLQRRGWSEDHPSFRREYLAEWTLDDDALVYNFSRDRNVVAKLPELQPRDEWWYSLGVDFGVDHHTAAVVTAYPRRWGRDAYVVHAWKARGLAPSDAAQAIYQTYEHYAPRVFVGDVGGQGKAFQAEWNKRFPGIPMVAAQKQDKRATLEFISDALYTARADGNSTKRRGLMALAENLVDVPAGTEPAMESLHREWATVQWDDKRMEIAAGQDDDVSHGALYSWKACPAYSRQLAPTPEALSVKGTTLENLPGDPKAHLSKAHRGLADGWRRR